MVSGGRGSGRYFVTESFFKICSKTLKK